MTEDASTLEWLADALGWARLTLRQGRVSANEPARDALGGEPTAFWPAAARLSGLPEDALRDTTGRVTHTTADGRRVVVTATTTHTTLVVDLEREDLLRRADAVDLAAGVQHEVANALTAILGWAARAQHLDAHELGEALRLIEACAANARVTARDLLSQTRRPPRNNATSCDLGAICVDVGRLLTPQAQQREIHIDAQVGAECVVPLDRAEAFRIVWNLALNALQHARHEVRLTVDRTLGHVQLRVDDDGPGMDPQTRRRALEPYFTTRADGTGLGLPLVHQTVTRAGGSLTLSADQPGTRVEVELPVARMREKSASGVISRALGLRVLLVEDDAGIRELVSTTLELRGCQVLAVDTIAAARAAPGDFDAALVDLTLSDGNGATLLRELQETGRATLVAGMSGAEPPPLDPAPDAWLRKPFETKELLDLLESVTAVSRRVESGGPRR